MAKEEIPTKEPAGESSARTGSTRLGSTISVQGDLEGHEDAVVEGLFKGKITLPSGTLTVARGAKVEAEVRVRGLILHGELTGTVFAAERIQVSETGRMNGNVVTPKIAISNGAQFKGGIKIEKV